MSADSVESHHRFREAERIPFHLIADPDKRIIKLYRVARIIGYRNRRVTYVIDKQGLVRGAYQHELAMSRHITDALRTLRGFNEGAEPGRTKLV